MCTSHLLSGRTQRNCSSGKLLLPPIPWHRTRVVQRTPHLLDEETSISNTFGGNQSSFCIHRSQDALQAVSLSTNHIVCWDDHVVEENLVAPPEVFNPPSPEGGGGLSNDANGALKRHELKKKKQKNQKKSNKQKNRTWVVEWFIIVRTGVISM